MSRGCTFVFMRHGEATHNVAAWTDGEAAYQDPAHADATLTDTGRGQCAASGARLIELGPYNAVYCSPLRRCRASLLSAIPEAAAWPVMLDDRLMEPQGFHICNRRRNRVTVREDSPTVWSTHDICSINPYTRWREIEGSASPHFYARVREFTDAVLASKAERVLIVSHHEWIRRWFEIYQGMPDVSPANAEVLVGVVESKS
jgi:broad specificity phosphatase PhoE